MANMQTSTTGKIESLQLTTRTRRNCRRWGILRANCFSSVETFAQGDLISHVWIVCLPLIVQVESDLLHGRTLGVSKSLPLMRTRTKNVDSGPLAVFRYLTTITLFVASFLNSSAVFIKCKPIYYLIKNKLLHLFAWLNYKGVFSTTSDEQHGF